MEERDGARSPPQTGRLPVVWEWMGKSYPGINDSWTSISFLQSLLESRSEDNQSCERRRTVDMNAS